MITPEKIDVANLLLRHGSLFIHLDPRVTGVTVPSRLTHQAQLVLQVGLDMSIPINDLRVTEEGISGTLSFSRTPFACTIPWKAIFAMVGDDARGMVWEESMPAEVKEQVEEDGAEMDKKGMTPVSKEAKERAAKALRPKPMFTLIKGGKSDKPAPPSPPPKAS